MQEENSTLQINVNTGKVAIPVIRRTIQNLKSAEANKFNNLKLTGTAHQL